MKKLTKKTIEILVQLNRPSGAKTWGCVAAPKQILKELELGLLNEGNLTSTSEAAINGTKIHKELLEDNFKDILEGKNPENRVEINQLIDVINYIGKNNYIGTEVPTTNANPNSLAKNFCGTADLVGYIAEKDELVITDLKMGRIKVEVERNKQATMYAGNLILFKFPKTKTVSFIIAQPLCNKDPILWSVSREEILKDYQELLILLVQRTLLLKDIDLKIKKSFSPSGDNCRYCKSINCPTKTDIGNIEL